MTTVKFIKPLYEIYFWMGTLFLKIIKLLVKPEDNLILFVSFGGKKFDDSPKAIYEEIIKDHRFDEYKLVWAFHSPEKFLIPRGTTIKIDTLKYFITALKARCWITNSRIERGLSFKGINSFYFNTWHGTPLKKMGSDIASENQSFGSKGRWEVDLMTSQSKYEADIFARVFNIEREKFLVCGLPRNDILVSHTEENKLDLRREIGLPLDKKVILYAPTFREYERDKKFNCVIAPPIDFKKWKKELGENNIILLRAHYEVADVLNVKFDNEFLFNVSDYPEINDLMIVSDLLISDYSSIFYDYSILNKPMLHYTYDFDKYCNKRGLYFDIRKELLGVSTNEEDLINLINNLPYDEVMGLVRNFRGNYVENYGHATKTSVESIYENIS